MAAKKDTPQETGNETIEPMATDNEEKVQLSPEQIQQLLEELEKVKAEAKKAKAEATKLRKASQATASGEINDLDAYLNERIPFKAPLINKDNKSLFVAVNGRKFLIQRGKTVMLPRYIVQHLANVDNQIATLVEMKAALQEKAVAEQLK